MFAGRSTHNYACNRKEGEAIMDKETLSPATDDCRTAEEMPQVIEEIVIEELNIDGVCGVY